MATQGFQMALEGVRMATGGHLAPLDGNFPLDWITWGLWLVT